MHGGAWRAVARGVTRVGHDLVTKPPPTPPDHSKGVFDGPCLLIVFEIDSANNQTSQS